MTKLGDIPRCPDCGLELVKATVTLGERSIKAWFCDCDKEHTPTMIREDIPLARPERNEIGYVIAPAHFDPDDESDEEVDDWEDCLRGDND